MAEYEAFSSEPANVSLVPCSVCSRTFMPEALVKHERICSKTSNTKRKVFQSGKQRAQGSDVPITNVLKSGAPPPSTSNAPAKKSNWREKHEQLVQGLRAARGVQNAIASGKPLPPPPPPAINPDYVQCPTCQRRFNETAAERHIPFCKEKNKRLPDKKTVDPTAQRRKDARVNYKTAKPKIKGREDTMYDHTMGNGINGYSAPMRTGRTEKNNGLNTRSGSLDRRKSSGDQRKPRTNNYHDKARHDDQLNGYMAPSPPGSGRPPSGLAYQHRSRESSARSVGSGDSRGRQPARQTAAGSSKFCHECGSKYCRYDAKFCCECGCRRMVI